ncbi:MAG: [FeFe] hydrogenase H-cluster radical SAM maturase HydE [Acutalibacteraceae bacterium]|nr:[FeFe] hydrogenase H-cluster radical SAM maturase HydE [Acutalibacteraceae bacterium]
MIELINKLEKNHSLSLEEYEYLILNRNEEYAKILADKATEARKKIYGNDVYIRGLIEISNICKNDCLYCGIRRGNKNCERYRLTDDEILLCCNEGYLLGFRTFVMQGGEDPYFNDDRICSIVSKIKKRYPDCAVTLSLGEKSFDSYKKLYDSGADRYLLRHETADEEHYSKLHPDDLSFENRMECLYNLKKIGFQTGCGFMVGSPYQTEKNLAKDLKFIEEFKPEMCGIGPFIPHKDTCFKNEKSGTVELTCYLLSIVRLISPNILLPSTTALGSIDPEGREKGILSGANVVMPNLSPYDVRNKYELYNNKNYGGAEAASNVDELKRRMESVGYRIVTARGDFIK